MLSPPRLSALEKGKGRATRTRLPTPAPTQSISQHRDRPGPNPNVQRAAQRLGNTSSVSNQHQKTGQRDSGRGMSQQEQRAVAQQWTHIGKVYGMLVCPWISEPELATALTYEEGQDLPEDYHCQVIVQFLEEREIKNHERKHPQFLASVSALLLSTLISG